MKPHHPHHHQQFHTPRSSLTFQFSILICAGHLSSPISICSTQLTSLLLSWPVASLSPVMVQSSQLPVTKVALELPLAVCCTLLFTPKLKLKSPLVDASTPRTGTTRNPFQQDSTRFKNVAADQCGETLAGGANDPATQIPQMLAANGGSMPQISPGGSVMMTLHQVNGDGAGRLPISADEHEY